MLIRYINPECIQQRHKKKYLLKYLGIFCLQDYPKLCSSMSVIY